MRGKRYTPEEAVTKIREYDVLLSQGKTQAEACKQIAVSIDTLLRWKKEFGGLPVDQVKRLKELEKENTRLKRVVADQALDIAILKEAASGNF